MIGIFLGLVLFIDMDSFYASCEEMRHPELRGRAFVVGTGDEENKFKGVVETASYQAKKLGIRSAMPVITALKIKKDLIYVPSDHAYYDEVSDRVMALLKSSGFKMETLSVDEAALDLNGMNYQEAEKTAKRIKKKVNEEIGLPCTIGVAHGKVLAKMICDSAKPDGLKIIKEDELVPFLKDKNVEKIPGVGAKTSERLAAIGIKTIGDIAKASPASLADAVGSFGGELSRLAKGVDNSQIIEEWKALSIGRERTLDHKTNDMDRVNATLDVLADEIATEMKEKGFLYKTVTVKARYSDFSDKIKSKSFTNYSDSITLLKNTAYLLMAGLVSEKQFRKVGVRVSSLVEKRGQKSLF